MTPYFNGFALHVIFVITHTHTHTILKPHLPMFINYKWQLFYYTRDTIFCGPFPVMARSIEW